MVDYAVYIFIRACVALFNALPFSFSLRLAASMGGAAYACLSGIRNETVENIKTAFKDSITEDEARRIAKNCYRKLAMSFAETSRMKSFGDAYFTNNVRYEGIERIGEAQKKGKGVVLLSAHFGNWELLSAALAVKGYKLRAVARPIDNPYIDRYLTGIRTAFGNSIIEKENALRRMLEHLKSGGILGILLDQRASKKEGVMVEFFGVPALTNAALAPVVARTGAVVLPAFIRREGTDKHVVMIGEPVDVVSTGDKDADALENTRRFAKTIESYIEKYPDEWFWFHSRWVRKKYRRA